MQETRASDRKAARADLAEIEKERSGSTMLLTNELEKRTGLGIARYDIWVISSAAACHRQKIGLLATRLGTAAANYIVRRHGAISWSASAAMAWRRCP